MDDWGKMDDKTKSVILFYQNNYNIDMNIISDMTISDQGPRICRFCGKDDSQVTFDQIAHAIPEMLGNKNILSNNECDICNKKFGKFESALDVFLGPYRSIMGIDGKKGIPDYSTGEYKITGQKDKRVELHISDMSDTPINEENKNVRFEYISTYIPIVVYKALVKVAISMMKQTYLNHFGATTKWLLQKDLAYNYRFFSQYAKCIVSFCSTMSIKNSAFAYAELVRKSNLIKTPYYQIYLSFAQFGFQYIVPADMDTDLKDSHISIPPFDYILSFNDKQLRERHIVDFRGISKVTKSYAVNLSYESKEEMPNDE